MAEVFNIAIDGPAGAGKSTIAKKVSSALEYVYVDTGAMYRAMALYLLRAGVPVSLHKEDPEAFSKAVVEKCGKADISIEYRDGEQVVLLDGENVNPYIRTDEVSAMASCASVIGPLREKLVELQQKLAEKTSVVMDGRDIGTVVLPGAQLKIYLTASVKERARRRFLENREKGMEADLAVIEKEIEERDHRDMTRDVSPLKQADDAILIDSSDMTIEEVAEKILNLVAVKKNSRR